jgi:hypothetical protein
MSLLYRRVDMVLSSNSRVEVREGDRLLIDADRKPESGELALVRRGRVETLCRWHGAGDGEVIGLVVGVRRKL